VETIWQDIRYGVRLLRKNSGFTLIAVITLALGIGANTAIFSVVNAVLLRPLPFKDPGRLVMVWERRANSATANLPISAHEFVAWKERAHSFESLTLIQPDGLNLTGRGDPVTVTAAQVSAEFFPVVGVQPLLGRTFVAGADKAGGAKEVVISKKLWSQRFGADRGLINQTITLNDQSYTVIGVIPSLELIPDVILPIDLTAEARRVGKHSNEVMGRLKSDVTLDQAQAELAHISGQLEQQYPNNNVGHGVRAVSLHEDTVGNFRLALLVLFGAVSFVLLIACANVANLLLTRAAARQNEMAIRTALGARRWRLIRQMLTESLLLSGLGGGLGLLLAVWLIDLLPKIKAINVPRLEEVNLDGRVLLATIGFSVLTGVLTGIVPAWRNSGFRLNQWISEGTRGSSGPGRRRIGSTLVVLEFALAMILLVGGGLMLKSFVRLVRVDPGFDPHQVLRLDLALPGLRYREARQQMAFYEQLIDRLKGLPGVESVGATTRTPLNPGDNWAGFVIEGRPEPPPGQQQQAALRSVSNDYFRTLKIPLRRGRFFSEADARVSLPLIRWYEQQPYPAHFNEPQPVPTVIINERMASLYWPGEDPVGRRLRIIASPWLTVVGVVGDVHHQALNSQPNPEMYLSHLQEPNGFLAVMMRVTGDPLSLAPAVREQVRALDKDQPLTIATMDQVLSNSVAGQRFNALLLGLFGGLALVLAMVGVFGVINYSVSQRTHEIGIRLALGAQRRDVFRLVVGHGLVLALLGIGIGSGGAIALTRLLTSLLYGVSPTDVETFVIVSLLLTIVALLACYIPARRATKVDPLVALRYE
jgi:putative ABC transport system permease protein